MQVFNTVTQSFFDTQKTLFLEKINSKHLKTCFRDYGYKSLAVIKYQELQFDQTIVRS